MFIPIATDCYRDTRPYGTYLLVALNIGVFAAGRSGMLAPEGWTSQWAELNWWAGLRSQFFHADWMHLIGNLLFLWVFAQVVEGAIGTRAFLLWLVGVALGTVVIEHFAFGTHAEVSGSYGASGIVFACIAGGFLLAPKTKVHTVYTLSYAPRAYTLGLPWLAVGYLLLEIMHAANGFAANSTSDSLVYFPYTPLLHVIGFAVGAAFAYVGLKVGVLDAGGWDWLSRRGDPRDQGDGRVGRYVMPGPSAAPQVPKAGVPKAGVPKAGVPTCEHCGRVRAHHHLRCIYCGAA